MWLWCYIIFLPDALIKLTEIRFIIIPGPVREPESLQKFPMNLQRVHPNFPDCTWFCKDSKLWLSICYSILQYKTNKANTSRAASKAQNCVSDEADGYFMLKYVLSPNLVICVSLFQISGAKKKKKKKKNNQSCSTAMKIWLFHSSQESIWQQIHNGKQGALRINISHTRSLRGYWNFWKSKIWLCYETQPWGKSM